jgi:hypothetical protein
LHIGKDTVVALTYRLTTLDGEMLEEALAESPAVYLQGGYDGIFPRVEAALEGQTAGRNSIWCWSRTMRLVNTMPSWFGSNRSTYSRKK